MKIIRRAILAFTLIAGIAPAIAQVPPPVPALPDTERRTPFSISASTCACNVGFALYGDSTDYQNWVEVYLNGIRLNFNDPVFGWTITSPTGPLGNIPRPITDAVMTFTNPQTGVVQIVGARRPRRASQFNENAGISARNFNQVLTDIISQNREIWDKTNDFTGRALISQPGVILGLLPVPSVCANGFLGFDPTGLIPVCRTSSGTGNVLLPVTSGDLACFSGTNGQMGDCGLPPLSPVAPHTEDFLAGTSFTPGVTASLTLSSTPIATDLLAITFDGIAQSQNTWSLSGATVTFNAAIPANTQVVEARWSSTVTAGTVVSSINSLTGGINLLGGPQTNLSVSGQSITVGNGVKVTCDGATDAAPTLQAAINATPVGGTLYIPFQGTGACLLNSAFNGFAVLLFSQPLKLICDPGVWLEPSSAITNSQSILYFIAPTTLELLQPKTVISGCKIGNPNATTRFGNHGIVFDTTAGITSEFVQPLVENVKITYANIDPHSCFLELSGCAILVDNVASNTTGGTLGATFRNSMLAGGVYLSHAGDSITISDVFFPPDLTDANASQEGVYANLISGAGALRLENVNCQVLDGCLVVDNATSVFVTNPNWEQIALNSENNSTMTDLGLSVAATTVSVGPVVFEGGQIISDDCTNHPFLITYGAVAGGYFSGVSFIHNCPSYPHALIDIQASSQFVGIGQGNLYRGGGTILTSTTQQYLNGSATAYKVQIGTP
jgi:hypothetical protein